MNPALVSASCASVTLSTTISSFNSLTTSRKDGSPCFNARSIFTASDGIGRPASATTIVSVCPRSASILQCDCSRCHVVSFCQLPFHFVSCRHAALCPESCHGKGCGPVCELEAFFYRLTFGDSRSECGIERVPGPSRVDDFYLEGRNEDFLCPAMVADARGTFCDDDFSGYFSSASDGFAPLKSTSASCSFGVR